MIPPEPTTPIPGGAPEPDWAAAVAAVVGADPIAVTPITGYRYRCPYAEARHGGHLLVHRRATAAAVGGLVINPADADKHLRWAYHARDEFRYPRDLFVSPIPDVDTVELTVPSAWTYVFNGPPARDDVLFRVVTHWYRGETDEGVSSEYRLVTWLVPLVVPEPGRRSGRVVDIDPPNFLTRAESMLTAVPAVHAREYNRDVTPWWVHTGLADDPAFRPLAALTGTAGELPYALVDRLIHRTNLCDPATVEAWYAELAAVDPRWRRHLDAALERAAVAAAHRLHRAI